MGATTSTQTERKEEKKLGPLFRCPTKLAVFRTETMQVHVHDLDTGLKNEDPFKIFHSWESRIYQLDNDRLMLIINGLQHPTRISIVDHTYKNRIITSVLNIGENAIIFKEDEKKISFISICKNYSTLAYSNIFCTYVEINKKDATLTIREIPSGTVMPFQIGWTFATSDMFLMFVNFEGTWTTFVTYDGLHYERGKFDVLIKSLWRPTKLRFYKKQSVIFVESEIEYKFVDLHGEISYVFKKYLDIEATEYILLGNIPYYNCLVIFDEDDDKLVVLGQKDKNWETNHCALLIYEKSDFRWKLSKIGAYKLSVKPEKIKCTTNHYIIRGDYQMYVIDKNSFEMTHLLDAKYCGHFRWLSIWTETAISQLKEIEFLEKISSDVLKLIVQYVDS